MSNTTPAMTGTNAENTDNSKQHVAHDLREMLDAEVVGEGRGMTLVLPPNPMPSRI